MNYKTNCLRTECSQGQVKGFSGKDLVQLSNGTVKVVRIEPMSVYPEHVHPDKTEYAFVMEGNPEFVINNLSFEGEVGDFYIFPVGEKHSIKNNTQKECCLLIGAIKN